MEKLDIMSVLDMLGVEYKRTYGKDRLLDLLAENVTFDTGTLVSVAKARGLEPAKSYQGLLDQLGVIAHQDDNGVNVGIADPAPVVHGGEDVQVICMVDNVHLGDGEILRFKDRVALPKDLADFLVEREQVEIV